MTAYQPSEVIAFKCGILTKCLIRSKSFRHPFAKLVLFAIIRMREQYKCNSIFQLKEENNCRRALSLT